jgi:hypothetical protein
MKKNLSHLIFLVDRSGSMQSIKTDMIGGFNSFIKSQKELPAECVVSFYQFDDIYESVFEKISLKDLPDLTEDTYIPRGCTALHDALGKTIKSYGEYLTTLSEDQRPERILVVTITDGLDNVSNTFSLDQVRQSIRLQKETYGWDFVFLGSNIDAWGTGDALGVDQRSVLQFASSGPSVKAAFTSLSKGTSNYRSSKDKVKYTFEDQDLKEQEQFLGNKKSTKKQ